MDEFGSSKVFEPYLLDFLQNTTTVMETEQFASIVTEVPWYYQQMIFFSSQTSTTYCMLCRHT